MNKRRTMMRHVTASRLTIRSDADATGTNASADAIPNGDANPSRSGPSGTTHA